MRFFNMVTCSISMRFLCLCWMVVLSTVALAQGIPKKTGNSEKKVYNIDNCVNEFSLARIESTAVGYQYWFVDKEFLDG